MKDQRSMFIAREVHNKEHASFVVVYISCQIRLLTSWKPNEQIECLFKSSSAQTESNSSRISLDSPFIFGLVNSCFILLTKTDVALIWQNLDDLNGYLQLTDAKDIAGRKFLCRVSTP